MSQNTQSGTVDEQQAVEQGKEAATLKTVFGIPVETKWISVERAIKVVTIEDTIFNMCGEGDTVEEAIEDYKLSLQLYFQELIEDEDNLTECKAHHLCYLRKAFEVYNGQADG